ncbi:MAG TPA: FAD-dependent oxidoreductase, partial [Marisediminicola sp.]|nr:FAD-dependent oxidoreductase [Marisediminicola sp.]
YGDDGVNIRFATGESLRVGRAVVTVPLGVLKSGAIRFEPSLPTAHIIATLGLGMGTVDKVWLRFDEPFWTTSAVRWTIVGGDLDITEWINLQPATGSPILVGLVGGERATALAELSDDEVIERARRSLEPFGSG